MTAPRRPADIAARQRRLAKVIERGTVDASTAVYANDIADDLDALDARWPTADEIADLRRDLIALRANDWMRIAKKILAPIADRLEAFLDRLDPPAAVEPADRIAELEAQVADLTDALARCRTQLAPTEED